MKEKDPIGNQPELTGNTNTSKLGGEGNIFMVDDRGTEEPVPPIGPDVGGESGPQNLQTGRAEIDSQTAENLKLEAAIAKVVSLGFDPEMVRGQLSNAVNNIAKNRLEAAIQGGGESENDPYGIPDSFEALVRKIEKQASENFKKGGENALITENGEVSKENFMAWIRDRMVFLHEFNPSSGADFFGGITIKAGISTISFYEMIFTGSYFLKKEVDEHGNPTYHQDDDYEKMKDQLITEAFVFGYSRNTHVEYTRPEIMGDENKLPEALLKLHYANPFTRSDFFTRFLTLPSMSRDKIQEVQSETGQSDEDFSKDRIKMMLENNTSIGEGVRRALLTYFHIGDYEMLRKIWEDNPTLFKKKYDKYNKEGKFETKDGEMSLGEQEYDASGNLVENEENIREFISHINIFNSPVKDESNEEEVRERIRQTLMSTLGIDRVEAKYAEAIAFSMTRWSGIGAKNDTEAAAYDAWTKPQKLLAYRLKQLEEKRKGVAGNIFNLLGIKRASLSWMEGITDEKGRTIIEAVQGGQGDKFSKDNPFAKKSTGEKDTMGFGRNVSTAFIQNHVFNAFGIYNFIINHQEFNMEQMVTTDETTGKPIIDQKKANEMIDKIQKWIRYAYCTWKKTDYGKTIRNGDQREIPDLDEHGNQKTDRNGNLATKMVTEFRNMPIGAAMFGEDIIRMIDKDMKRVDANLSDNNKLKAKEDSVWDIGSVEKVDFGKMNDSKVRDYLWKQILTFFIAEEIESHRNINSELSRFNYATLERIYDFLEKKDLVGPEAVEEIRNLSHTTQGRVLLEEGTSSILLGFLGGLWKEIRKLPSAVTAK